MDELPVTTLIMEVIIIFVTAKMYYTVLLIPFCL